MFVFDLYSIRYINNNGNKYCVFWITIIRYRYDRLSFNLLQLFGISVDFPLWTMNLKMYLGILICLIYMCFPNFYHFSSHTIIIIYFFRSRSLTDIFSSHSCVKRFNIMFTMGFTLCALLLINCRQSLAWKSSKNARQLIEEGNIPVVKPQIYRLIPSVIVVLCPWQILEQKWACS